MSEKKRLYLKCTNVAWRTRVGETEQIISTNGGENDNDSKFHNENEPTRKRFGTWNITIDKSCSRYVDHALRSSGEGLCVLEREKVRRKMSNQTLRHWPAHRSSQRFYFFVEVSKLSCYPTTEESYRRWRARQYGARLRRQADGDCQNMTFSIPIPYSLQNLVIEYMFDLMRKAFLGEVLRSR